MSDCIPYGHVYTAAHSLAEQDTNGHRRGDHDQSYEATRSTSAKKVQIHRIEQKSDIDAVSIEKGRIKALHGAIKKAAGRKVRTRCLPSGGTRCVHNDDCNKSNSESTMCTDAYCHFSLNFHQRHQRCT